MLPHDSPNGQIAPLDQLNNSVFIQGLGNPITKIEWAYEGITRRWWIHFENGPPAYIPNTKTLRSPAEMEIILSDTLGKSVLLQLPQQTRAWRMFECNWMMECAKVNPNPAGGISEQLRELVEDAALIFTEVGSEISGRKAAAVFAAQSSQQHLEQRFIGVKGGGGLFLHLGALVKVWQVVHGSVPTRDNVCAALIQEKFHYTNPYPTGRAKEDHPAVRMWFKPDEVEFLNDDA